MSPSLDSSRKIEYVSDKKCRARVESMPSLHLDPSLERPFESKPVRVSKSRARSSPSLDSSSKIEYESAKKCRARVESMPSLHLDPSLVRPFESEPVRVLKSRARSSPSLDSSSKIEYESAKKCRVLTRIHH